MRLFTGISLPSEVIVNLQRLLDSLRPTAHLRWSAPYNLHITTKFIGDWREERLQELTETLHPLGRRRSFPVSIAGMGWIPNPHSPRVLFAGVKVGPELAELAKATDDALAPLGIEREKRAFKAHLTLARIKDSAIPLAPVQQHIARLDSTDFGCFSVTSFKLYLSKPGPAGSIYTQLAEIPFTD